MGKITPCLWFNFNAQQAYEFYASIFDDVSLTEISRYTEAGPGPTGELLTGILHLGGQDLMVLNGGPDHRFTEAFSLFVSCDDQQEVDRLWSALTADGGEESVCGWLQDMFGLSWQIVPDVLGELLGDRDREKANRVVEAMLQMRKLDVAGLRAAYERA
jgi:predicted 3-demethylubiquinone-9 3-methyltransferase (glyoxalase superfamily)